MFRDLSSGVRNIGVGVCGISGYDFSREYVYGVRGLSYCVLCMDRHHYSSRLSWVIVYHPEYEYGLGWMFLRSIFFDGRLRISGLGISRSTENSSSTIRTLAGSLSALNLSPAFMLSLLGRSSKGRVQLYSVSEFARWRTRAGPSQFEANKSGACSLKPQPRRNANDGRNSMRTLRSGLYFTPLGLD